MYYLLSIDRFRCEIRSTWMADVDPESSYPGTCIFDYQEIISY